MFLLGLLSVLVHTASTATSVPAQYIYSPDNVASVQQTNGCKVSRWTGMDAGGMAGYPWCTTIECEDGEEYKDAGISLHGHVRFYLRSGSMTVNNYTIDIIGGAYWIDAGARAEVSIRGSVYILGAAFALVDLPATVFTSSYKANSSRAYDVRDAIANGGNGTNGASVGHDPHICNGTTNAKDITWSKYSVVDPPSIAVLNCAPDGTEVPLYGKSNFTSYVWFHSHPQGAVYLPYSGEICFQTDSLDCIQPGYPRWTSANLYYIEFFRKIREENTQADELVKLAGMEGCEYPVTFGVTNFDPDDDAGKPNFDDVPENVRPSPNMWGTFPSLTVRNTVVQSAITVVKEVDEL